MVPRPLCNIMCRRSCVTHAQFSWPGCVCECVLCLYVAPMTRPERTTCCKYSEKSSEQFMSALLLLFCLLLSLGRKLLRDSGPMRNNTRRRRYRLNSRSWALLISPSLQCSGPAHSTQPMSVFACIGKSIIRAKATRNCMPIEFFSNLSQCHTIFNN